MNMDNSFDATDKQAWEVAFESQFPDLMEHPTARTCFREGWMRGEEHNSKLEKKVIRSFDFL
jgi:hypothetical protein